LRLSLACCVLRQYLRAGLDNTVHKHAVLIDRWHPDLYEQAASCMCLKACWHACMSYGLHGRHLVAVKSRSRRKQTGLA
jgi:hypothetical protein